jgi:NAD(P) transhydrogenase subunit alpha
MPRCGGLERAVSFRIESGIGGSSMMVGVPRESFPGERRVALVPAALANLAKAGLQVVVEAGPGEAGYPDADYAAKGANIVAERSEVFRGADIVVQVLGHGANDKTGKADLPLFHGGQILVGFLRPFGSVERVPGDHGG